MLDKDRFMKPDMEKCLAMVRAGEVWDAVKDFIPSTSHTMAKL